MVVAKEAEVRTRTLEGGYATEDTSMYALQLFVAQLKPGSIMAHTRWLQPGVCTSDE